MCLDSQGAPSPCGCKTAAVCGPCLARLQELSPRCTVCTEPWRVEPPQPQPSVVEVFGAGVLGVVCFLSVMCVIVVLMGGSLVYAATHNDGTTNLALSAAYGLVLLAVMVLLAWMTVRWCRQPCV